MSLFAFPEASAAGAARCRCCTITQTEPEECRRGRAKVRQEACERGMAHAPFPFAPFYSTVIETGFDGIPFAITTSELAPVSMFEGTSKWVETLMLPVATAIVL